MSVTVKEIALLDISTGKDSSKVKLPLGKINTENGSHLYYLVDKFQKASKRAGTAATKNRSAVSGGGAKPYKQKGTGHARRGTNRTPLMRGGGVIFGPSPRSYEHSLNGKTIKSAIMSAMAQRESDIIGITSSSDEVVKTKDAKAVLEGKKLAGKKLALLTTGDENLEKALRNLPTVKISSVRNIPIQTLIQTDHILISENAANTLQEIWK